MLKTKAMQTITKAAILTVLVLAFAGCGEGNRSASETAIPDKRYIASAPTTDPRVVISAFRSLLEPAGVPLTDDQQERIKKLFIPGSYDLRPMFGVLTDKQKLVLAEDIRSKLAGSEYPVSNRQFKHFSTFGPKSKVEKPSDILTPEQLQVLIPQRIAQPYLGHLMEQLEKYTKDEIITLQYINRLEQVLAPAGESLTEAQKDAVIKTWHHDEPDQRPLYGVLTEIQKRTVVIDLDEQLAASGHSLSTQQTERIMDLGPDSTDRHFWDIFTPEQNTAWSEVQKERRDELGREPYEMALRRMYIKHSGFTPTKPGKKKE